MLVGMGSQRIIRVGPTVLGEWRLRCGACLLALWNGSSEKKEWPLTALLLGRKLSFHPSSWYHTIQSLLVCLCCLLIYCPSAWAQSKWIPVSPCVGPLKGTPGTLAVLCHIQPQFPLVFTASSYGNFSSWHWKPGMPSCFPGSSLLSLPVFLFLPAFLVLDAASKFLKYILPWLW